jgi:two-component system CheB/CheR fusion protein
VSTEDGQEFENLLEYLKSARGFDFTGYKRPSLVRRVTKRMQDVGIDGYTEYRELLEVQPDEFAQLFDTILINVTSFFRDRESWTFLAEGVLPGLIERSDGRPIRCWSAGCASGEEVYSLAMLLAEAMGLDTYRDRVKIYATDVDDDALTLARQASYAAPSFKDISPDLRERYFEHQGTRLVFRNDLRRTIIFGRHDLVRDPPISRLDLLVCRNTLMYLNHDAQARILRKLHFALNDRGVIFLGRAEMLLSYPDLFLPLDLKHRIFGKVPVPGLAVERRHAGDPQAGGHERGDDRLWRTMVESAPVAQLGVDADLKLVFANARARRLFGIAANDIGRPLKDLQVSYRPLELRSRIEQATGDGRPVSVAGVERELADGTNQVFDVLIIPFVEDGTASGIGIVFDDVTRHHKLQGDLERSNSDLATAYEELQSTNEELETTNEELHSTNEELETTNEELQATNEELETMNEELQSTNQELQALNDELEVRSRDLRHTNAFVTSVLTSLRITIVVLDASLNVETWTAQAEDMWGERTADTVGKAFLSLDMGLPVGELAEDLERCLKELLPTYRTVDATNRRGKPISCRVTCVPLSSEGILLGVVLLMEETP